MNNLRFTGAIFDMDGTIIDSMALWKNMAWGIFEENDLQIPKNLEENIYSMTFLDAAKYCIQISNTDKKAEELVCDWEMRALDFYDTKIEVKPYVEEFLEYLKQMGICISLTTSNFEVVARKILKRLGLIEYFDSFTFTQEVTRSKHYPDVFNLAAERLCVKPSECIVFEDSLSSIKGAKAAGMFVVGVQDVHAAIDAEEIKRESDLYIKSFDKLIGKDELFKN